MVLQNAALHLFNSMSDKRYMQIQDERNVYVAFLLKTSFCFFITLHINTSVFLAGNPYLDSANPTAQDYSPENKGNL